MGQHVGVGHQVVWRRVGDRGGPGDHEPMIAPKALIVFEDGLGEAVDDALQTA